MKPRLGFLCGQQNWKCHYCKREMSRKEGPLQATVDERHPRAKGGMRTLNNQVAACRTCNGMKADMPYNEFMEFMQSEVYRTRLEFLDIGLTTKLQRRRALKKAKKEMRLLIHQQAFQERWASEHLPKPPADLDKTFKAPAMMDLIRMMQEKD